MISRPTILRSVIGRFLPGVLAFFGGGLYLTARVKGLALGPAQIETFTGLMLFMTLGFVTCVSLLRRVLPRAAGVDGRRSVLAGFTAPMILLALDVMHGSPISHAVNYTFAFVAGSAASLAMIAPWIARRSTTRAGYASVGRDGDDESGEVAMVRIASLSRPSQTLPPPQIWSEA